MLAGVAGIDVTPPPGLSLQGHVGAGPSTGVLRPLEVRAIVFRRDDRSVCIVTLDVIGVTRETTETIRAAVHARTGMTPQNVVVACSHTHCAPATLPCLGLTPDESFMRAIIEAAAQCAAEAAGRAEPVKLGLGCGSAHFNVNRRPLPGSTEMAPNFGGIVDRRARVLRIDSVSPVGAGDSPLAVLFHYSCHPTTKSGRDGLISPDFPGVARAQLERALGCRAMFLQGCCGNVRPLILDQSGNFASATVEQLDRCASELANAVSAAVTAVRTCSATELRVADADVNFRYASSGVDSESSIMQAVRIGPLVIITIPGEPVQEIGHAVERALRGAGAPVADVWPVGYANDMVGYLCTRQHHVEGGYEPTAYRYFGRPAPFEDEEQTVLSAARELWSQITTERK